MQCDIDEDIDIVYHSICPLWCEWHKRTQPWYIDFTSVDNTGGDVFETVVITDSLGFEWIFEGAEDPSYSIAVYNGAGTAVDPASLTFDTQNLSNGGSVKLVPKYPWALPHFNRQYGWTMRMDIEVQRGSVEFEATTKSIGGASPVNNCGQTTRFTVERSSSQFASFFNTMSKLCEVQPSVDAPPIRYTGEQSANLCHFLSVEPCEHTLFKTARVSDFDVAQGTSVEVWLRDDKLNSHPRFKEYLSDCDTWRDDPVAEQIRPPYLLGDYNPYQKMSILFDAAGGGMNTHIQRFQVYDFAMTPAQIAAACPLAA